jgi:hypothetical protein
MKGSNAFSGLDQLVQLFQRLRILSADRRVVTARIRPPGEH